MRRHHSGALILRTAGRLIGLLMALQVAGPALAQLSLGASLTSDYRLRAYSLSRGQPAASARIGYDDASGLFADATGTVFLAPGDGPRWMGGMAAVGYARRLRSGLAIDVGLLRAQFSPQSSLGREAGYTEVSLGITGRMLSARIAYSPDYYREGVSTLYGSLDASIRPADKWRLSAHAGAITRLTGSTNAAIARTQYDWRGAVTRILGPLDLELSLSGGGPNDDYYDVARHSRTAVVATVRVAF